MNVLELADKLKELKDQKRALEDHVKEIKQEMDSVEAQLIETMVSEEMQNFNRGGTLFYMQVKPYASPIANKKPVLFQTLKDEGYGDLVYETVNSNSLSAFVREQMEENEDQLPEWLNGLVNVFEKTSIRMRKSK